MENIYPKKFTERKQKDETRGYRDEDKKKFDSFYKHAISIYQFRTDVFTAKKSDKLNSRFQDICENIKDWDFRYYDRYWIQYKLNFLALILVDTLPFF